MNLKVALREIPSFRQSLREKMQARIGELRAQVHEFFQYGRNLVKEKYQADWTLYLFSISSSNFAIHWPQMAGYLKALRPSLPIIAPTCAYHSSTWYSHSPRGWNSSFPIWFQRFGSFTMSSCGRTMQIERKSPLAALPCTVSLSAGSRVRALNVFSATPPRQDRRHWLTLLSTPQAGIFAISLSCYGRRFSARALCPQPRRSWTPVSQTCGPPSSPIPAEDAKWLQHIGKVRGDLLPDRTPASLQRMTFFLDTHCALLLRNGAEWYDVHPIIRADADEIVRRHESIAAP